jgi:tetratricopeptide (TPR) repeat protein
VDPSASTSDGKFIGRGRELNVLDAGLQDARRGQVRLLALVGEAGIGKTSTVEEFIRRADLASERVVWGRCSEQPGAPTFWPWVRAIRDHLGARDAATLRADLAGDAEAIVHLVPSLRDQLGHLELTPADVDDPEARFRLFDGVASFFRRQATRTPLVIVMEDVHWADEASLLLLGFVARETRNTQLLIIVTYRDRQARRWPRAFADVARLAHRVVLRGLDRPSIEKLVARSSVRDPSPALVERLLQLTEGNPFFLDEILRVLGTDDHADAAPASAVRWVLPDSLRETIGRRLDPLSDDERSLLALAAVVGREFDVGLLQTAAAMAADVVLARLTAAAAIGLVEEHERAGSFRFTHALIREMLYGDLLPATRAELHRRVAAALEANHPDPDTAPLDALALHYFHAAPLGVAAKAFDYSMQAGRRASKLYAHGDAMSHYERALAALSLQPPDDRRRFAAYMAHGRAAWRAGHNPKARESYRLAARYARTLGDREGLAAAALLHGEASPPSGAPDPASVGMLEEALATVGDDDGRMRTLLLAMLARALYFSPDLERCRAVSRTAVEVGRRAGDPGALAVALLCRQLALIGPGSVEERLALQEESHRIATEGGIESFVHNGRLTRILCLFERGQIAAAVHEIEQMRLGAERTRIPERQWHVTVQQATVAQLQGRFEDAARLSAEALAVRRDASDPAVSHVFLVQTYICRTEAGHAQGLEESIRGLANDYPAVPAWRCILALLLEETGRREPARRMLDELAAGEFAAVRRDFLFPASLAWLSRLVARLRDAERARVLYDLLLPFADRNIVVSLYSPGCLGSAEAYLGLLAVTRGDRAAAIRHLEAGIAANERMGARPILARSQYWLSRILMGRDSPGDRERAAGLIAAARASAMACGMTVLLADIGEAPTAPPPSPPEPQALSPVMEATLRRELEYWTVRCGADGFQLKDTKGIGFLRALLQQPGQELHVLDLAGGPAQPGAPTARQAGAGDAGELLDRAARTAYKQRLEDLREELDEAERLNDPSRSARARREIDFLGDELARAVGLGGRDRRAASAAERARINVTRTIAAVLKRITAGSPVLGEHLAATVRTGYFCSYSPDPRTPVRWSL